MAQFLLGWCELVEVFEVVFQKSERIVEKNRRWSKAIARPAISRSVGRVTDALILAKSLILSDGEVTHPRSLARLNRAVFCENTRDGSGMGETLTLHTSGISIGVLQALVLQEVILQEVGILDDCKAVHRLSRPKQANEHALAWVTTTNWTILLRSSLWCSSTSSYCLTHSSFPSLPCIHLRIGALESVFTSLVARSLACNAGQGGSKASDE
jgi:hypothetical protein